MVLKLSIVYAENNIVIERAMVYNKFDTYYIRLNYI